MAETKTVHLPNRGPVTVSLDEWEHLFGTLWRVRHETARLVESHDDAIEAVRAVIDEMAADTELRRELAQQTLSALLPVPLT